MKHIYWFNSISLSYILFLLIVPHYFNLSIWGVLALNCRLILSRITRHMHKYLPSSGQTRKWGWFESSPSPVLTAENSVRLCWSWTCTDLILQQALTRSVAAHLQMQTAQQEHTDKHKHGIQYMAHIVWVCLPAERHRWTCQEMSFTRTVNLCSLYRQQSCLVVLK